MPDSLSPIAVVCSLLISIGGCAAPHSVPHRPIAATRTDAAALMLSYEKGQVLSFAFFDNKIGDAAEAVRRNYYQTAFPLAVPHGLNRDANLTVRSVPVGSFRPGGIALFSWPDVQSEQALYEEPEWPGIKATRSDGWDELRIVSDELESELTLTFDPDKTYTLATAWLDPDSPNDYEAYMAGIRSSVTESGGKFLYEMYDPRVEAHSERLAQPGQVTLVEWASPDALEVFQKSRGFQEHAQFLSSGTTRFELLLLSFEG